jgi:hypothetical protein
MVRSVPTKSNHGDGDLLAHGAIMVGESVVSGGCTGESIRVSCVFIKNGFLTIPVLGILYGECYVRGSLLVLDPLSQTRLTEASRRLAYVPHTVQRYDPYF